MHIRIHDHQHVHIHHFSVSCLSKYVYRYHGMCRFWSKTVFDQPAIKKLDYYARLDDDSFLLDAIDYDIFNVMKVNKWIYSYVEEFWDPVEVIQGMFDVVMDFAEDPANGIEYVCCVNYELN